MRLTEAQLWALQAIGDNFGQSPATLGRRMMERPGAKSVPDKNYKAQALGRMGGAMMARLAKKKLVSLTNVSHGQWHPTMAQITSKGLGALAATPDPLTANGE